MKLMTKEIEKRIPKLYATENVPLAEKVVHVKIFNPYGIGTWLIFEYDPETKVGFGLCDLGCAELGYVDFNELSAVKVLGPLGLERDRGFGPILLPEAIKRCMQPALNEWAACVLLMIE